MPMGSSLVSIAHLKLLISSVPKEIHGLVMSDICPDDRQNYGSLQKIMQHKVLDALIEHIVGSDGTVMFLRICAEVTSSLIDEDLLPSERIYRLSHAKFFFRAWRIWLKQHNLSIADNCISTNANSCIEINAENLISVTRKFRDEEMEELFMPTLFNSQPNEEIFRLFRSM